MIPAALSNTQPGDYGLILPDVLYCFLPIDGEGNSNECMTCIYNMLDAIAGDSRRCNSPCGSCGTPT